MAVLRVRVGYIALGGLALAAAWFLTFKTRLINALAAFVPSVEGFRSHPYWDVSRYSWGYGTQAPGSTGTISRDKAFADMVTYLLDDYEILKPRITRVLTVKQWAAYLSFSYNLGTDDAIDIVPYINAHNDIELRKQWMRYINSGGQVNPDLIERRQKEWALWVS